MLRWPVCGCGCGMWLTGYVTGVPRFVQAKGSSEKYHAHRQALREANGATQPRQQSKITAVQAEQRDKARAAPLKRAATHAHAGSLALLQGVAIGASVAVAVVVALRKL